MKEASSEQKEIINSKLNDEQLKRIQSIQLEMFKEVVRICNKHNLTYFIDGGTLLGAVRHKGFIPWDDDIDLSMPREDYEKFLKIAPSEINNKFRVRHFTTDDTYKGYFISIASKEYKVTVKKTIPLETFVGIDVMALDGIPDKKISFAIYKFKVLWYRMLVMFINVEHLRIIKRSFLEKILIGFAKITHIGKLLKLKKIRTKQEKLMKSNKYERCNKVGCVMDAYGFREIYPKEWYGKGSKAVFEGDEYSAPEKQHECLKHIYGDYMQLPPLEKRVGNHILKIEKIKAE